MTGDGTTGPCPRLSPAPIVTDMDRIERRKADHYDKYRDGCGLCHGLYGFFESWVVIGITGGLRSIHPACVQKMLAMGYELREERRSK